VNFIKILSLILLAGFLNFGNTFADQRSYVWTYEYLTLEKGSWELEYYNTISTTQLNNFRGNTTTQHQIELEIGMNESYDFAIYQIFSQKSEGGLHYDGFKFRGRYKLSSKGKLFFNPLIYLEYQGVPDFQNHGLEFKLILTKDFENINLSLNPYVEFEKEGAGKWEFKPQYALGLSYKFSENFTLGIESKGSEKGIYLGPTFAHGNRDLWIALSPTFSIGKVKSGQPEFYLRLLLGFGT
jgi:hypothetical protein